MFQKLLKIVLSLTLLNGWLVQSQISLSLHNFNKDFVNDIFYGRKVSQKSEPISNVKCEGALCTLNTNVKTDILLQRGNVKIIELNNDKLKRPVKIEIAVLDSRTVLNYEVKYLSPYYDVIYGLSKDKNELDRTENLHHATKGNSYIYSNHFPETSSFRKYSETKEITEINEKFKCGSFLSASKLTQTVALAPRPNEGNIIFSPGNLAYLLITLCVKDITSKGKSKCATSLVQSGETIALPELEGIEDAIKIRITDIKTPKIPINTPDIIGEYTYNNVTNSLQFSNLHIGSTPSIGVTSRDSISPLQSSTVITENKLGEYKSFEPKSLISWNLLSSNYYSLPPLIEGKIKGFTESFSNFYTSNILVDYFKNLILDESDMYNTNSINLLSKTHISSVFFKGNGYTYYQGLSDDKKLFYQENEGKKFTDAQIMLSIAASEFNNSKDSSIMLEQDARIIFCATAPEMLSKLESCLNVSENMTINDKEQCIKNFVEQVVEISNDNKYLAAYFGIFKIKDDLVEIIHEHIEVYCFENKFSIEQFMQTSTALINPDVQRAFWIPLIIGIVLLISAATSVGAAEAVASTKNCRAQEIDISLEKQRSEINNFPEFSTLYPNLLKEFNTGVSVHDFKPLGAQLNITNFEDQIVKLEVSTTGYSVDFNILKSKIQDFTVNNCVFYLSKAISTCELIFNNVGDVSEVSIKIKGQDILSVTNKIVATVGINKHSIQLSTPEIIDKNIEVCIVDDEDICGSPEEVNIIENPDIVGDDLVPKGGIDGNTSNALRFWNLLNLNVWLATLLWIMWIIGVLCIIIMLIVIFSCFRVCCMKLRRLIGGNGQKGGYEVRDYGNGSLGNVMMLVTILNCFFDVEAFRFTINTKYSSPSAYHLTIWNPPKPFDESDKPTYGSFNYGDFQSSIPPLYDFTRDRVVDAIIQKYSANFSLISKVETRDNYPDIMYETDGLMTPINGIHSFTKIDFTTTWSNYKKKVTIVNDSNDLHFDSNTITSLLSKKIVYNEDQHISYYQRIFPLESDLNRLFRTYPTNSKQKPIFKRNVRFEDYVGDQCDMSPWDVYYRNDGLKFSYTFCCIGVEGGNWTLRNYTFIGTIPNPDRYLYVVSLLNKEYINNQRQPALMVVTSEAVKDSVSYLSSWLKRLSNGVDWFISTGVMTNDYSKIVMLWCDKCELSIMNQKFTIKSGTIRPKGSFCLLPSGKVSGVKVGEGPRFKCLCDSQMCYCFNLMAKVFSILELQSFKVSTTINNITADLNIKEISLQCFSGDGGNIQLSNKGDFVAVGGPVQITSDNWDNIDVIESGNIVKAPINQKKENSDLVEIKTLGAENLTFITIQKSEISKEATFDNTWGKMNKDFPYVIPLTIGIPCFLLLLLIFSCCYRYCRGGKRVMKMLSYPIVKTTGLISENFGIKKMSNNGTTGNNYLNNMSKLNDRSNYRMNDISIRQRGRRPVV